MTSMLVDWLLPLLCTRCGQEGHSFCLPKTQSLPWPRCLACRRTFHAQPLGECLRSVPLVSLGNYANRNLREAIKRWKFDGQWARTDDFARLLARILVPNFLSARDHLIPIPLHWTRLFGRGYNQARLLADRIRQLTGRPLTDALFRQRKTRSQTELSKAERERNVSGAFGMIKAGWGGSVWLVDDVITSGATMTEAIRTLGKNGWRTSGVITIAHTKEGANGEKAKSKG